MRSMSRPPRILALAGILVLAGALAPGCATTKQVRSIVAETNMLMVAPDLYPGPGEGDGWKEVSKRIDALIAQNADQKPLVASLRARQALLLTTFKQDALAREAWKQVDRDQLKTDRDRAFYLLSDELIWWFKFAPSAGTLGNNEWGKRLGPADIAKDRWPKNEKLSGIEFNRNESTVERFEWVCDALSVGSDTRLYLEVMRANIVLRAITDAEVHEQLAREKLAKYAVWSVERLVRAFDASGQEWLKTNLSSTSLPSDAKLVSALRPLSQGRIVMKETRHQADEHSPKIEIAKWKPDWVDVTLKPVPEGN